MPGQNAIPPGVAERLLRRDRVLLGIFLAVLFTLAGLYTVFGVGMNMTALEMTAMRGMSDMPGATAPGQWSAARWILMFLMWWVMMVAMMLPSVSPTDARQKIETWRREYNEVRPHGAIGDRPPMAMLPWLGTVSRAAQMPGSLI